MFQLMSLQYAPVPKSGNVIDNNRRLSASARHAFIPVSMPFSAAMWKIYRQRSSPALVTATLQDFHRLSSTVHKEYNTITTKASKTKPYHGQLMPLWEACEHAQTLGIAQGRLRARD